MNIVFSLVVSHGDILAEAHFNWCIHGLYCLFIYLDRHVLLERACNDTCHRYTKAADV